MVLKKKQKVNSNANKVIQSIHEYVYLITVVIY